MLLIQVVYNLKVLFSTTEQWGSFHKEPLVRVTQKQIKASPMTHTLKSHLNSRSTIVAAMTKKPSIEERS